MPPEKAKTTFTFSVDQEGAKLYTIIKEPIDLFAGQASFATDFYVALGKLVIQWGHVERQLNLALEMCRRLDSEKPVSGPR